MTPNWTLGPLFMLWSDCTYVYSRVHIPSRLFTFTYSLTMLGFWPKYLSLLCCTIRPLLTPNSFLCPNELSPLHICSGWSSAHRSFTLASASHFLDLDQSLQFLAGWLWATGWTIQCPSGVIRKVADKNHLCKVLTRVPGRQEVFHTGWLMFSPPETGSSAVRIGRSPILLGDSRTGWIENTTTFWAPSLF